WSSIMSTLAEDDSSNGAPKIAHRQSKGPRRYAYIVRHDHGTQRVAGKGISPEAFLHQQCQDLHAFAHVSVTGCDPDSRPCCDRDHRRPHKAAVT
ncbi:hypothetical protein, partial [Bradyrhizobium sp. 162]|uniref:hypothetical protein n=1 Tax=Bradyrhizobium sp. 162 TaxID=2782635 RepID=UPI001FFBAC5C